MGVVDEYTERLTDIYRLHPAGDGWQIGDPASDLFEGHIEVRRRRRGRQAIGDVVTADQPRLCEDAPGADMQAKARPLQSGFEHVGRNISRLSDADRRQPL